MLGSFALSGGFYDRSLEAIRIDKPDVIAVGIAYPEQKGKRAHRPA